MPLSTFLGREAERDRLVELVDSVPLVTVTGPGGIGKTRLVEEALADHDRVVRADLAALPAGAGVDAVASEIGFESPEAAAASLGELPGVVVLDSCEHVLDAVAELVTRLTAAGDVHVVTTSREPVGVPGEHVIVLGPLALPAGDVDVERSPAVQLFLDRATGAGATLDRSPRTMAAIAQLCRELDGLPLAIELAAARSRALAPPDLLAHMAGRLDLLRTPAPGRGRRPRRHDSLRAVIEASVDLLEDDERSLLCSLGVFAGSFTVELAHAVGAPPGADRLDTIDALTRLVDRSLLVSERAGAGTRYRLLRVVRAYVLDAGAQAGRDGGVPLRERYVDAMVAEAEAIVVQGVEQWSDELVARVDAAFRDLVAAIERCVGHDQGPERAYRLLLPLFASVHESRSQEVLAAGRAVLDRWPGRRAPWRGEALAVLATAAVLGGDHAAAEELGHEAAADHDALAIGRVIAHRALGLAARAQGELLVARGRFAAGRHEAGLAGAASFERELATYEASTLALLGQPDEADELLGWVVDGSAASGDAITEAGARLARATTAITAGRWDDARRDLVSARVAVEAMVHPWWQGALLRLEAAVATGDGDGWDAAVPSWRRAVDAAAAQGSTGELALTLRTAAVMAAAAGREDVAAGLVEAIPDSDELGILPQLFPEELFRLEAAARGTARRDVVTALRLARDVLTRQPAAPATGATQEPPEPPELIPVVGAAAGAAALRRAGDGWVVSYGGTTVSLRHLKGLSDLAVLLAAPGAEVHCLQLIGGADVGGEAGPVIDGQARRAYETRIRELQAEIDDAAAEGRPELAAAAEVELDALVDQLAEAFGLGGRARPTGSSAERARTAVTYRVRAAIRKVAILHPELGRHLANSVRTGTWCSYRPETEVVWVVQTAAQTVSR